MGTLKRSTVLLSVFLFGACGIPEGSEAIRYCSRNVCAGATLSVKCSPSEPCVCNQLILGEWCDRSGTKPAVRYSTPVEAPSADGLRFWRNAVVNACGMETKKGYVELRKVEVSLVYYCGTSVLVEGQEMSHYTWYAATSVP